MRTGAATAPVDVERREDAVERTGITLVLGGAGSGKSEVGEAIAAAAAGGGPVTYVATGPAPGSGEEPAPDTGTEPGTLLGTSWEERVATHRARRPPAWSTAEVPPGGDLGAVLRGVDGVALVDSLGTWVAGLPGFGRPGDAGAVERGVPAGRLLDALGDRLRGGALTVVVTEEVGLGVHPSTAVGGAFREALGRLNRDVAQLADPVLLVVAGRVLPLERVPSVGPVFGTAP